MIMQESEIGMDVMTPAPLVTPSRRTGLRRNLVLALFFLIAGTGEIKPPDTTLLSAKPYAPSLISPQKGMNTPEGKLIVYNGTESMIPHIPYATPHPREGEESLSRIVEAIRKQSSRMVTNWLEKIQQHN